MTSQEELITDDGTVMDFSQSVNETTVDENGVADFTPPPSAVRFKINDDVFVGVDDLSAFKALEFSAHADKFEKGTGAEKIEAMKELFKLLLTAESSELFLARLNGERGKPIGFQTTIKLVPWLFEQYGFRPTEPSPS